MPRQPITHLTEGQSTLGVRSLFAAQQQRILRLSEHGGNWKILGAGFGGTFSTSASAPRFRSARLGDYLAFTNDFDAPMYHILEQIGETGESLYEFEDMALISMTRAKFVWSWRNFLIFANVEMDNQRYAYRLVSSDFDNPISLDPARADSIAWTKDLMTHEEIIGGAPSGNEFLIYTTHGIWAMSIVGGTQVVGFRRVYNGEDNRLTGLLALPNTLANLGDTHIYAAEEPEEHGTMALYAFNQFMPRPERPEWLHRATPIIFDNINRDACEVHIGAVRGSEYYIFTAQTGDENECPSVGLRVNYKYQHCDKIDFGFTALGQYASQDQQSVRDFIVENRICTLEGMLELDDNLNLAYENEGLPNPLPTSTAEFEPMSIYTINPLHMGGTITVSGAGTAAVNGEYVWNETLDRYEMGDYYIATSTDGVTRTWALFEDTYDLQLYSNQTTIEDTWSTTDGGDAPPPSVTIGSDVVVVEDYEQTVSDEDSLCALLGDETVEAGCRPCRSEILLVGAASDDWCLKQLGGVFYREECANPEDEGENTSIGYVSATGAYILNGYTSIWRTGPMWVPESGVHAQAFAFDYQARLTNQSEPSDVNLRVAISGQVTDPNEEGCLVWHNRSAKKLRCQSTKTESEHRRANTQPAQTMTWNFEHRGPVLYFEWSISGVGGDADFSRVRIAAKPYAMRNL